MPRDDAFLHADPSTLSDDDLGCAVSELAAHIHAATWRLLVLVAELDRRLVWAAQGARSCAHWLGWACGIDAHTAREKIRTAHALESLPLIAEQLRLGRMGYSKVRALTRVATPDNEADLVNIGLHGTAGHVEKFVRLYRGCLRAEECAAANERHSKRELVCWHDDDGSLVVQGRFPPEMGAKVLAALDAAAEAHEAEQPAAPVPEPDDPSYPPDVPRGTRLTRSVRRADALAWMADRLLEGGGKAPVLANEPHEIVVHVDAEVLEHGGAGRCHLDESTALAAQTARRLSCDASVVPMVDGAHGEPLAVGRRTRSIPPAIRRALAARDRGCRFPGCTSRHRLHGHHVRHWASGGETRLDNLVLLCPYHHRLVHEGGFDVRRIDDGAFRFLRPDRTPVRAPRAPCDVSPGTVVERNRDDGLAIDAQTSIALWHGEAFDYTQGLMGFFPGPRRDERDRM